MRRLDYGKLLDNCSILLLFLVLLNYILFAIEDEDDKENDDVDDAN